MDREHMDARLRALQEEADEAAWAGLGEAFFRRWRNPLYFGFLADPDGEATVRGECGDHMTMQIKVAGQVVCDSAFWTDGCGPSLVCGSYAAEMARGRTLEELLDFRGEAVLEAVGRLPEDHAHCAFLAARTLAAAANDVLVRRAAEQRAARGPGGRREERP